jgi:hypothetical protein
VKPVFPMATSYDGTWSDVNGNSLVAGEVLGTIP